MDVAEVALPSDKRLPQVGLIHMAWELVASVGMLERIDWSGGATFRPGVDVHLFASDLLGRIAFRYW